MSFLLISVANRLGCKSVNVDNILTYKKIFVLALITSLSPTAVYGNACPTASRPKAGTARGSSGSQ